MEKEKWEITDGMAWYVRLGRFNGEIPGDAETYYLPIFLFIHIFMWFY